MAIHSIAGQLTVLLRNIWTSSSANPQRADPRKSLPALSPASSVPRPEHPLAATELDCSSNSREETAAMPASLGLPSAPTSAIPGSGNWRSCPAPKHTAERHPPNACPSSQSQCRRSRERHRCHRPAYLLEFCLHRLGIPDSGRDEVVQLIVVPTASRSAIG